MKHALTRSLSSAYKQTRKRWGVLPMVLSIALALLIVASASAVVMISATKTDALVVDIDGDGKADPGDTIEYTVVVANSGTDATGVAFDDTIDANTTLVPSSVAASPVAVNDILPVTVTGNVAINTALMATPFSVVANDFQGQNMSPGLTISTYDTISAQGGQVTMVTSGAGIGRFTYEPTAGYEGADTFSYTLSDNTNAGSAATNRTATVTINISGMIWFVNNNATSCTSNGCGRLSNPYSSLAAFHSANDGTDIGLNYHPAANDTIFIYESASPYTGGVALLSGQKLIGQDATQSLSTITGLSPAQGSLALPAMNATAAQSTVIQNSGGDAITINEGNTIRGLTISGTSGAGILGVNRNALTVGADVAMSGVSGVDLSLDGGNGTVSFGASVTNTAGRSISIINRTGGTATLTGPISDTGTGVLLDNNDNATITIAGGLALSTGSNAAFTATGGGTVNVCDENPCNPAATGALVNTLTTTSGTALNVTNTTIGANNLEFRSISSSGGTSTGIILVNTGSTGALVVKGDGTTTKGGNGSGGTITNKTGGTDGDGTGASGVYINNGSATLRNMTLTRFDNFGVYGLSVNNVTLQYSTVGAISGSACADADGDIGTSSGAQDAAIAFGKSEPSGLNGFNSSGTALLDNLLVRCSIEHQIEIYQQRNSFSATVSNSDIKDNSTASGSDGILIETHTDGNAGTAAANGTITIQGNAFDDNKSQAAQAAANGDSVLDVTIDNNTVVRSSQGNEGFILSNGTDGRLTAHITNNNISGIGGTSIFVGQTAGNANALAGGAVGLTAFIKGNTITTPTSATNHALIAYLTSTVGQVSLANILIESNTIAQNSTTGTARPFLVDTPDANTTPSWTATVLNNNITFVDAGTGSSADVTARRGAGCFDVRNNTVSGPFGIRVRQASPATVQLEQGVSGSAVPATVLDDNHPVGTVTSVLVGTTITVVGNSTCLTPPLAMMPSNQSMAMTQPTANDSVVQVAHTSTTVNDATIVSANTNPADRFNTPLGDPSMFKLTSWVVPQNAAAEATTAPLAGNPAGDSAKVFAPPPAPAQSGEAVNVTIGNLPASKSVTIKFRVTVDDPLPLGKTRILNQGTVSGSNFSNVLTSDSAPSADPACAGAGTQTCTPVDRPDTTVVSLTRQSANPNRNAAVTWQIVFADPVDNLSTSNFSLLQGGGVSGALISSVTETSGPPATTWNISANTGTGDGTLELRLANDTGLSHDVTNAPYIEPANGAVYTIDKTAPTVSSIVRQAPSGSPTNADLLVFRITFNEAVTGVGAGSFVATGTTTTIAPSVSSVTPNLVFDFSVDGSLNGNLNNLNGTVGLNVGASPTITDLAGNTLAVVEPSPASNDQTYTVDNSAPTVASIVRQSPSGSPTNADLLVFRITFNESVTGVGAGSFVATGTTTTIAPSVAAVTPNLVFDFSVDGALNGDLNNLNGTVGLDVSASPTITDLAGNTLAVVEPSPASNDQTYTLDNTAPTVTINQAAGQTDPTGTSPINFTVVFNEAMTGFATGDVNLSAGTAPGTLTGTVTEAAPMNGTAYNVAVGGMTGNGTVIASINAGVAADAAGNGNTASTSTDRTVTYFSPTDLGITKTDGVTTAVPGESVTYTITASNAGPNNAPSATVADTFPASLTVTWTCVGAGGGTCTAAGSGNINDTVNLPAGGSVTYTASASISASATGTLANTATVSSPATDPNPGNNSATDTDALTPLADLGITKTDGVATAVPGGSVTYTITASNAGPSNASNVTVADTFPASLTVTWTCVGAGGGTCTAAGSGNINDTVNLPAGGSVTYTASASISAAASGSLSNTATVSAATTDPNPGNNSATDTDTLTPQADLSITKTDGVTTAVPGGSVTYIITASNSGPSNAPDATVADTFPASLTATWTCVGAGGGTCTAAGSGNIIDTVNLPAGGSVTYTASATISAAAAGSLSNTATVSASTTDPNPANNSATDTDTLAPQADLSITKTDGVTTATPGGSLTYTITASNAGPSNAAGATVADTFPASLTATWTCVGAGGGTCTAAGSGNINDTVNLPAGGSVTYTASASISAAAAGSLSNTATVAAPGGVTDPDPANNSATDTDTVVPSVAVIINQKTSAPAQADPASTSPINFTVVFGSPVTDFDDASDVTLSGTAGATTAIITGGPTTYNVAVSGMTGNGTVIAAIAAGVATGSLGELNAASTSTDNSVTFSPVAPVATGIVRAGASPTNAATVAFSVTFSEAVTGVDAGDFSLASSVAGPTIASVSGSGATRTVTVSTGSGSGTLGLNLVDNDTIVNASGTRLGGTGAGNGNVTGQVYTIDKTAPQAGSLAAANITSGGGTTYSFTVVFSDNLALDVASLDGSDIRVTGPGGFNQAATLVSVSPATSGTPRTATYRISAPGGAWDSADNGTYTLALQASQVRDSASNPVAAKTLGTFSVTISVVRHTVFLPMLLQPGAPDLVTSISISPNRRSFTAGEPVVVSVTVTNQGSAAAAPFWVDLYINPSSPPTAANQIWNTRCGLTPCFGMVWQVAGGLAPGQSITLSSQSLPAGYSIWPGWFAAGSSDLYAYVDSFNPGVAAGAVAESDEANNRAELRGLTVTGTNPALVGVQDVEELPARPSHPER